MRLGDHKKRVQVQAERAAIAPISLQIGKALGARVIAAVSKPERAKEIKQLAQIILLLCLKAPWRRS